MDVTGPVHFIWLGGEWLWQHWRAVETARRIQAPLTVEGGQTIIWAATDEREFGFYPQHVEVRSLDLPDWLRDHPIQLANVKDLYMWRILHEHGGLYLDLDTISLRPVWDLIGDFDVCVSTEFPTGQEAGDKHNSAVVIGRKGAPVLKRMAADAYAVLLRGESKWGTTGPDIATRYATWSPYVTAAPYPLLNGWSYHSIGDYFANPRDPGKDVRVIHLYSSDNYERMQADRWMP